MPEIKEAKLHHNGHVISVGGWRGWFTLEETEAEYETYKQACDAADRLDVAKRVALKSKLSLSCVDEGGTRRVITGIHAGNFSRLIHPKPSRHSDERDLYPETPSVVTLINRLVERRAQVAAIEKELEPLKLKYDSWDLKRKSDIAGAYAQVNSDYNKKAAKAEASKP